MESEEMGQPKHTSITLLMPAGRVSSEALAAVLNMVQQYDLEVYLSTLQNIRLNFVPVDRVEVIRKDLAELGVTFKQKGIFRCREYVLEPRIVISD